MENATDFTEITINYSQFYGKSDGCSGGESSTPKKDEKRMEPCEMSNKCDGMYECHQCGKSFLTKAYWKRHLELHEKRENVQPNMPESKGKMPEARGSNPLCELCKRPFSSKYILEYHKLRHHQNRKHKCNTCGKAFGLESDLKNHKQTHKNKKAFKCKVCDKEYSSKYQLNDHLIIHDPSRARFICTFCEQPFLRESVYNQHMRCKHSVWKCTECHKKLASKYILKNHMKTHNGQKDFPCDICDKKYLHKNELKFHQKKKHPNMLTNTKAVETPMKAMADALTMQILISTSVNKQQTESSLDTGYASQLQL